MPEPYIAFENVVVSHGENVILNGLSFSIDAGEFVCILGPSGCGKSTTLRLMSGLLQPQSGTIRIAGRSPESAHADFAFVFQSPRLVAWRNAIRNVTLSTELRNGSANRLMNEKKALELLTLVGLAQDGHKRASELSGGEKQRVAIARALHVDPRTLLMDEPFSALDVRTRESMRREIVSLWEQQRKTVIFVTHDIDEAIFLADRIIVLSHKPTVVEETIRVGASRPRDMDHDLEVQALRKRLYQIMRDDRATADSKAKL